MTTTNITAKPAPLARPTRPCRCGCGAQTQSTWVPGHDAQAKGLLLAVARGLEPKSALERLGDYMELATRWGLAGPDGTLVAPAVANPGKLSAKEKAARAVERALTEVQDADDAQDAIDAMRLAIAALRA